MNRSTLFAQHHIKDIGIGVVAGLILAAIFLAARTGPASVTAADPKPQSVAEIAAAVPTPSGPLTLGSDSSEVVGLMMNSHEKWVTLNLDATTIWYSPDGSQTVQSSVLIEQFAKVRILGQQWGVDGKLLFDWEWLSDGSYIYQVDRSNGTYQTSPFPVPVTSLDAWPTSSPPDDGPALFRHPMAMLMQSQLADYIYPVNIVQLGTVSVLRQEQVAGRDTLVVLWERQDDQGNLMNKANYWVDTETGVILKAVTFGGNSWTDIAEESTVTRVEFDQPLAADVFSFNPTSDQNPVPVGP